MSASTHGSIQFSFTATPPSPVPEGTIVKLEAEVLNQDSNHYDLTWSVDGEALLTLGGGPASGEVVHWNTAGATVGTHTVSVKASLNQLKLKVDPNAGNLPREGSHAEIFDIHRRSVAAAPATVVTMRRTASDPTRDIPLWVVIRRSSEALSFKNFDRAMSLLLCGPEQKNGDECHPGQLRSGASPPDRSHNPAPYNKYFSGLRYLPFTDTDAYRLLKVATEAFVMVNCGVPPLRGFQFDKWDAEEASQRLSSQVMVGDLDSWWGTYLRDVNGLPDKTLPYLAMVAEKLPDQRIKRAIFGEWPICPKPVSGPGATGGLRTTDAEDLEKCYGVLQRKLSMPCFLELIWSYWHEEGMLVQTINAISNRFQNQRGPGQHDPLVNMEIDPLRPLNNLLWGYIQDEQHRLTVVRRASEYIHHYGFQLEGKAIPPLRPADSRTKFLEAFHNLLYLCTTFFKEDDDTTVIADGFPVLNALKDVHLVLSEGAHNQFGDLPSTARVEMLMQQWLLARPEFREFLPTRIMVAYPERWMDRVDAMKSVQGWTDVSSLHFHNLAVFGEQLLLSIRYGAWSDINEPAQASNWARYWRAEIQGYNHAYRAATGVDLTAEVTDTRQAQERYLIPSVHLRNRLLLQRHNRGAVGAIADPTAKPAMAMPVRRGLPRQP